MELDHQPANSMGPGIVVYGFILMAGRVFLSESATQFRASCRHGRGCASEGKCCLARRDNTGRQDCTTQLSSKDSGGIFRTQPSDPNIDG
jgi:hypothetical protein